MKSVLLTLLFCLNIGIVFCQSSGDYRTRQSGNWNQTSTWEVFNGGAWQLLSGSSAGSFQNVLPSHNSGTVTLTHIVELNHSLLTLNQTIIQSGGRLNVRSNRTLRLIEDSQTPLTVAVGGILSVNGTVDLTQLTSSACAINGLLTSNGLVSSPSPSRLLFNDGSIYDHVHSSGGSIPLATWSINSLCQIAGLTNTNPAPINNLNQAYGNFLWNTHSMGSTTSFSLQGHLRTVNGNLILRSTGTPSQIVRFDNSGPGNALTVGGDFIVEGGQYIFAQNQTSSSSITIGRDFIMSGGGANLSIVNNHPLNIILLGDFVKTGGGTRRRFRFGPGDSSF